MDSIFSGQVRALRYARIEAFERALSAVFSRSILRASSVTSNLQPAFLFPWSLVPWFAAFASWQRGASTLHRIVQVPSKPRDERKINALAEEILLVLVRRRIGDFCFDHRLSVKPTGADRQPTSTE
jgi:hypothetical protein